MPAYKTNPSRDWVDWFLELIIYNVPFIAIVTTLLWVVFPHFGIWRLVALITAVRMLIHGSAAPPSPAS